jgi:hypothetical protein
MITIIDQLNYDPCENHQELNLEGIIRKYDDERKNERMFNQGIEEDDFLFIDVEEMDFLKES